MDKYNIVAENPESTVVAEFQSPYKRETAYQTEDQLEKAFIQLLQGQAYDYLKINSEAELVNNLRVQLQKLNNYTFSNNEWDHFFRSKIANPNSGIEEKTTLIQEDHIQILDCDDGTKKNIYLLDKTNIHNNQLQVINQYEVVEGQRPNRYDVTILVNGLPLVHIELKKGVLILRKPSTKLTVTTENLSGVAQAYLSMYSCLSYPTELIPSTTAIPQGFRM